MDGRKIDIYCENPIDNVLIDLSDPLSNLLYKMNITPNMVTIFRLLFILYQTYNLYYNKISINTFILSYIFYYYLDCVDGYMARKYNLITKIGDILDHVTDISVVLLVFYLFMYSKYDKFGIIITIITIITLLLHLGCQEQYNSKDEMILGKLKYICPSKEYIQVTKYFGCATYNIVFLILLYYYYVN
jgi:phosphatidylglycerophosphate synthase